mmetsp:Transcript_29332/g.94583  ORF Transcript_29332/g.94583 Transcript_29332/m.94583 type:complete len:276 (-) Transcript_29332:902-1729(-)|eukprot:scaffold8036_cov128-Isochrysis_galbana.AAC.7
MSPPPPPSAITAPPPEDSEPKKSTVPPFAPGAPAGCGAVDGVSRRSKMESAADEVGAGGAAKPPATEATAGVGSLPRLRPPVLARLRSLPSRFRFTLMDPILAERLLAAAGGSAAGAAGAGLPTSKRSWSGAGAGASKAAANPSSGGFHRSFSPASSAPFFFGRGAVSLEKPSYLLVLPEAAPAVSCRRLSSLLLLSSISMISCALACTLPASLKSGDEKDCSTLISVFMSKVSSRARSGPCTRTDSSTMSVLSSTRGRWLERSTFCQMAARMSR